MSDENVGGHVVNPPPTTPTVLAAGTYAIQTETTLVQPGGSEITFASGMLTVS